MVDVWKKEEVFEYWCWRVRKGREGSINLDGLGLLLCVLCNAEYVGTAPLFGVLGKIQRRNHWQTTAFCFPMRVGE
jgi:hypothetical protein